MDNFFSLDACSRPMCVLYGILCMVNICQNRRIFGYIFGLIFFVSLKNWTQSFGCTCAQATKSEIRMG